MIHGLRPWFADVELIVRLDIIRDLRCRRSPVEVECVAVRQLYRETSNEAPFMHADMR